MQRIGRSMDLLAEIRARVVKTGMKPLPRDVAKIVLKTFGSRQVQLARDVVAELVPVEAR